MSFAPLNKLPPTDSKLWKIFNFNRKYATSVGKIDSIQKLLQKTKFNYDHHIHTQEKIEDHIEQIYIKVNESFPEILSVVSNSLDIKIYIDFTSSSSIDFQPTDSNIGVTFYKLKCIIIGAKNILSKNIDKYNYALSAIAHEFMHFAMFQVYENDVNPYYADDKQRYQTIVNIREKCSTHSYKESIIKDAYYYKETEIIAELIARVPQILLACKDNQPYIDNLKTTFSDLFNFYYNDVLPDVRDYINTIEIREKVKEFNDWFDLIAELEADDQVVKNASDVTDIKNYLNDKNEQGVKIFETINSKSAILKLYHEFMRNKTIAIFMPLSFFGQQNFPKVLFNIYELSLDVPVIIHSEQNITIADLEEIFPGSTLKKIVVVKDVTEPVPTDLETHEIVLTDPATAEHATMEPQATEIVSTVHAPTEVIPTPTEINGNS